METKMNKFAAFAAAGVLSVSALVAGQAAADNENSAFAQAARENTFTLTSQAPASDTVGYGYNAGFISKSAHQNAVSVRYLGELSLAEKARFSDRAKADPSAVQALQAQIRQNADAVRGLNERNVSLSNVIGASQALDGTTTYIVR
jgi:hypothetical protein